VKNGELIRNKAGSAELGVEAVGADRTRHRFSQWKLCMVCAAGRTHRTQWLFIKVVLLPNGIWSKRRVRFRCRCLVVARRWSCPIRQAGEVDTRLDKLLRGKQGRF